MDPWRMFSELCQIVVKSQNVYLDVIIYDGMIGFQLLPMFDEDDEDECV